LSEVQQRGEEVHALILALHEEETHSTRVVESLKLSGHNVLLSKNFSDAIKLLQSQHVDLIISDVHLENGGDVFDFLRWVKQNPSTKDTPFVLFSSEPTARAKYFEDGLRTTARVLGASLYLSMDIFDSEEFRKQIESLLPVQEQPIALDIIKGSGK
jgi:CheY-like chemotaxis protein